MKYELMIAPSAHEDIAGIKHYIANDDPQAADNVAGRIYATIDTIESFPKIGGSVSERFGIKSDYLFFVVLPYTYIVFYKIEKAFIFVDRILDGRRDCVRVLTTSNHQA